MSLYPAIKQNKVYSIQFNKEYEVMFEDLDMIDINRLAETIKIADYENIIIVPNSLSINTKNRTITIIGHKINDTTWFVTKSGKGNIYINNYSCTNDIIINAIQYLYHIVQSHHLD